MRAEQKLEEARYFLEKLKSMSRTISAESDFPELRELSVVEHEFKPNFSAFITALKSTFDILLYDYAERYLGYGPGRNIKLYMRTFEQKAKALRSSRPIEFAEWWKSKMRKLEAEEFWSLRDYSIHRGGSKLDSTHKDYYTLGRQSKGLVQLKAGEELSLDGMPETVIVSECERVYELMASIVAEARRLFV